MLKRLLPALFVASLLGGAALVATRTGVGARLIGLMRPPAPSSATNPPVKNTSLSKKAPLDSAIVGQLKALECAQSDIRIIATDTGTTIRAKVPLGLPIESIVGTLTQMAAAKSASITDCYQTPKDGACYLTFASPGKRPVHLRLTRSTAFFSATARMALVIDRFGFDTSKKVIDVLSYPEPLTVSVLPATRKSTWTAQIAGEYKKEIVVLLPMEPEFNPTSVRTATMIMVHYPEERIRRMVQASMAEIPNFAGCANYLGSRVLADPRVMEVILSEVRSRHGYFLESRETQRSVAAELSTKLQVPYADIDSRVSTGASAAQIDASIVHAVATAQSRGRLILSLPATAATIEVLKSRLKYFKTKGIRLVLVSELAVRR